MYLGNPIQGEAPLVLGSQRYTLLYDWRALAVMADKVGTDVNLFDPATLATVLVIGLAKRHPGVTADMIFEASPPLGVAISDFNRAMRFSYFGHKQPTEPETVSDLPSPPPDDRLEQIAKAYATAFRAGIRPADFWDLTPYQTNLLIHAHAESMRDEFETLISASWHTAVFTNSGSKIPPLKSLFRKVHDPTRVMDGDDDETVQAKAMIAEMMGATKARTVAYTAPEQQ
jgi:hypothetical protein